MKPDRQYVVLEPGALGSREGEVHAYTMPHGLYVLVQGVLPDDNVLQGAVVKLRHCDSGQKFWVSFAKVAARTL